MSASRRLGVLAIMMMVAQPAWAHHVMDGTLPQTFLQGLLSGFGHPVIGVDHLAAIVGIGILAELAGRSAAVGLTTLLIGALVILRQSMSAGRALLLFALAGLVHGYALGESIVGAEASPLVAYLLGLLVMQTAIGVVVYAAVRSLARWPARTSGLTVAGVLVALAGGIATAAAAGLA